ncbi:MAG: 8-amino-7-oxononanoate synthase [Verrucomicrobia bacterium]|nr:8-amino-7-oxononanoate synthase [Verrucomicrobiota bacterium]
MINQPETEETIAALRAQGLYRTLNTLTEVNGPIVTVCGRKLVSFASNDYLGLSQHPAVKQAAIEAIEKFGFGSGASRLITGTQTPHSRLESDLAALKKTEAAIVFSSGYTAALGTLSALFGPKDVIILDKLSHACLIDGARLSGARLRVFPHNNLERLAHHLAWARETVGEGRVLLATEAIFSMDGDCAALQEIAAMKGEALLLVDEAHATGVLGPSGRGLVDQLGLSGQIDIQMGTLSKAIGASGGFVCGPKPLIELLINKARSFIYSTAPPACVAAAASAAIQLIVGPEGDQLRDRLWANIKLLWSRLGQSSVKPVGPIFPYILGEEKLAVQTAKMLSDSGFLVPAIRYPTVPRGAARLRIVVSALHAFQQIEGLTHLICNRESAG